MRLREKEVGPTGLDMYLMAEQRVKESTTKFHQIQDALTEEHLKNLADEDWGNSAYVSGWDFGPDTPMRRDAAYQLLAVLTQMLPTPQSPHFDVSLDTENGDYLVRACCAYWRKANQIHKWFVDQTQGGMDDGQMSPPIHGEVLADLMERCKRVLETPALAAEVLPTEGGFFFGSTDYDEWYIGDLKDTVSQLTHVFETYPKPLVVRYHASW